MKSWPLGEKLLLVAFLFWSAAGFIFTAVHITPEVVAHGGWPSWLASFIQGCIRTGDPLLILLAFGNTHVYAARQWGPARARHWGLILLVSSLALETLGASTGFPFGPYHYTDRFGPLIGIVPFTIPLAWYVVVTNALFLVRLRQVMPSRGLEAAWTALLCTAYDFVLEPFAAGSKHYWIWQGGTIPLQNYLSWFVLSFLLVWLFAPRSPARQPADFRPLLILGLTLLIFLAGR